MVYECIEEHVFNCGAILHHMESQSSLAFPIYNIEILGMGHGNETFYSQPSLQFPWCIC